MHTSKGVSGWTQRFVIASALSMIALQVSFLLDVPVRILGLIGLFAVVLPMVFGMGYLLLPPYFGQTLSTPRLPGIHLILTYTAIWFLLRGVRAGVESMDMMIGTVLWGGGVTIFVGSLVWTVLPSLPKNAQLLGDSGNRSRRTTRLTILMLPVAVGYLVIGTIGFVSRATQFPDLLAMPFPMVLHLYGAGFVVLLIFTLGIRLIPGFFHVTPPASLSQFILLCGAIAPGLLALHFWQSPWFVIGASLELLAFTGYVAMIALVVYRTDRRRVGLYAIGMGAIGGFVGVGIAVAGVVGFSAVPFVALHVPVVLNGFLIMTIVGYAYQFFPVTTGQFRGATPQTALTTILSVGAGTGVQSISVIFGGHLVQTVGVVLTLIGTVGYAYLLSRRLL